MRIADVVVHAPARLRMTAYSVVLDRPNFEEGKHPRGAKGTGKGGQFVKGQGSGGASSAHAAQPKSREAGAPASKRTTSSAVQGKSHVPSIPTPPKGWALNKVLNAASDAHNESVLRSAFVSEEHLQAMRAAFEIGSPVRKTLAHRLRVGATAPAKLLAFAGVHEAKEWRGAARAVVQIAKGQRPGDEEVHAAEAVGLKLLTMAGIIAVSGEAPGLVSAAAWGLVAHEFVTHTVAEHLAKFGVAAARLGLGRKGPSQDAPFEEDGIATLANWLADAVENASLQGLWERARAALEEQAV